MMMSEADVYVQVLYDFQYVTDDGNEVSMKEGEELLVLKKSNNDWWQVIRDSEKQPFYAPSSYLDVIGQSENNNNGYNQRMNDENANMNQLDSNECCPSDVHGFKNKLILSSMKSVVEKTPFNANEIRNNTLFCPLSFNNPLCSEEIGKEEQNNSGTEERNMKLQSDNVVGLKMTIKDLDFMHSNDDSSCVEDPTSPIYVNIPLSTSSSPPTPKSDDIPHRILCNSWLEYIDENGRKYYYNTVSGKITWKPPRRKENSQSNLSNDHCSPKSDENSLTVPEPPPKQLKPKLRKLNHSSTESLDSPTSGCMFTILPLGWSQECDLNTGTVYYINEVSDKRWFSSSDENGRTYFYDEDSSESLWELPDLSLVAESEESKDDSKNISQSTKEDDALQTSLESVKSYGITNFSSPKMRNKKVPKLPVPRQFKARSLVVPETVHLSNLDDGKNSLPRIYGDGYWPSVQDGHFSITRKGTLNKTKLLEGGRRVRKNWTSSFVVLTDVFLLFYKDMRSAHMATPCVKPEICIDLNGAFVDWSPDKSSRRNVFQISTLLGHLLLLQDDNAQTTKEWFDSIQAAIMRLPNGLEQMDAKDFSQEKDDMKKDVKLNRSKSTKQYYTDKDSSEDVSMSIPAEKKRKIRDKLRHFFIRRPTMESLREKGIILDEPVFGCHLENLCIREKVTIPRFVVKCIETIERKELTADGLYRASGNLSQVQKIRFHVNQDDYSCLDDEDDVHVLTGALKMFFREMKEPLFPFQMFDKFLNAIALPDSHSKLKALKELIYKMPEPNYETLKFLLQHLLKVTQYHKQNRMQIQNLAIVFGPTLLWPEQESINIALDMMHQNRIVEFLLLEFFSIFK